MVDIAAIAACIILGALAVFQLALISGAPIGKYAWGGVHAILPKKLRVGSAFSILLYILFAIFILTKAGIIDILDDGSRVDVTVWMLAGYFYLGVVMNAISRSKPERNLMTPVALVLALLVTYIALS